MENFKVLSVKPLAVDNYHVYKGVAYDGCYFYFTQPEEKKIYRCDMECNKEECFHTTRGYYSICYDYGEHCYWACGNDCSNRLYQLDETFTEINILEIQCGNCGEIMGVSYYSYRAKLLVAFLQCVMEVDKVSGEGIIKYRLRNSCYKSVLSVAPYDITSQIDGTYQTVSIYSKNGELLEMFECPKGYVIEDMLFRPYQCNGQYCIYLLATKQGKYPCLLKCNFTTCILGKNIYKCNFKLTPSYNDWPDQYDRKHLDSMALIDMLLAYLMNKGNNNHEAPPEN